MTESQSTSQVLLDKGDYSEMSEAKPTRQQPPRQCKLDAEKARCVVEETKSKPKSGEKKPKSKAKNAGKPKSKSKTGTKSGEKKPKSKTKTASKSSKK
jgi:hypothetical protein